MVQRDIVCKPNQKLKNNQQIVQNRSRYSNFPRIFLLPQPDSSKKSYKPNKPKFSIIL